MNVLKVGVVDDHKLFRRSLISLIKSFKGVEIVLEAENGIILLDILAKVKVDILLLDIQMPLMDGYVACKEVSRLYPDIKILIVSHIINKESMHLALEAGAHGYFSKNADPVQLETAIKCIHDTGFYFEPTLATVLHDTILWDKKLPRQNDPLMHLTEKELSLIRLFCYGYPSAEIADKLCVNIRTVESYRNKIIDKTEAKNFTNVILMAIKYKYVATEDILAKI